MPQLAKHVMKALAIIAFAFTVAYASKGFPEHKTFDNAEDKPYVLEVDVSKTLHIITPSFLSLTLTGGHIKYSLKDFPYR
ncbi:hypothetical protein ElyMa_002950200 [Elysia marginata]|uniref:Uncharacterized protein n=1 Tax=Elysia marginata TaxID=1093978 RepID=A0AAV4I6F2_9GAST|nr:hypothetical protein ElyMa_002950200 [Elysia marginata]